MNERLNVGDIGPDKVPARMSIPKVCRDYLLISTSAGYRQIEEKTFPLPVMGGNGTRMWVRGADVIAALGLSA